MAESADHSIPPIEREGITVLYGDESSEVDIVILHGLNGHPQNTWTHDTKFFWPWELKNKVPNARVMVFGYNADVASSFADNLIRIRDIGRMLLSDLVGERQEDEERERPIIFMGHSLGGLVIKQAILLASKELHNQESDKRLIYTWTRGLFFFGTPHLGSRAGEATRVSVLKAIAKAAFVRVPPKLDSALKLHSDELNDLTDDFRRTSLWLDQRLIIYSYYESFGDGALGDIVVDQASALTGYDKENSQPVQRNHQEMVKFANKDDRVFKSICGSIRTVMRATSSNVAGHAKVPIYPAFAMETVNNFVPRKALLNQIWSQLTREPEGRHVTVRMVGIWGSGGTGKSQLARAYLQEYGIQYDSTFWIHAVSPAALERCFQDIYHTMPNTTELPLNSTAEKVRAAVLMWFFRNPGKWLFVFDEADELSEKDDNFVQISNYIPAGNKVHVIITSRSSIARDLSTYDGVEIRTLEPPDAVTLFLACAKIDEPTEETRKQVELIVNELGRLPLALTIGGSYVARTPRLAADLSQYLKEHRERLDLLRLEPQQLIDMYGRSLMSTWETSYMAVYNQLPDACLVFSLLGFLGNDDIYLNVLTWAWPQEGERHTSWCEDLGLQARSVNELEECFSILERYSMIQQDTSKGAYSMHSLVHAWSLSRLQAKEPGQFELFTKSVPRILSHSATRMLKLLEEEVTESNRQAALQLVPHLRSGLQVFKVYLIESAEGELMDGLQLALRFFDKLNCTREGLLVLDILIQKSKARFGHQHPDTISLRVKWGGDTAVLGNWDEGIKTVLGEVARVKNLGDEHPAAIYAKKTLEGLHHYRRIAENGQQALVKIMAQLEVNISTVQETCDLLIGARPKLDEITRELGETSRSSPLWAQAYEVSLARSSHLDEVLGLGSALIAQMKKELARKDLNFFAQQTVLPADMAGEYQRATRGLASRVEGMGRDVDKWVDLYEELQQEQKKVGDLLKKLQHQAANESLWETLKHAVKQLL